MDIYEYSLEELENAPAGEPAIASYVAGTCHAARKKPLSQLSAEEIRLLIGQKTGLQYLLPPAVEMVCAEPLTEVTFYEGDLLNVLLRLDIADWQHNLSELAAFRGMLAREREVIAKSEDVDKDLLQKYL
ncbi:contact-dependent growth inhibition system immunity protein [Ruminococcus sp.]|uniref:contact-dependent growth inhibition system immunity protein n=1 Tax=Ruminococcus sp. TaxID=41978 RepID=UPI0025D01E4E|nr:contact-dependent growth inhibition system immunity protein [Ruminococcus sp.]MBQ8967870.1 hypothetical protein [Ruminococcus sp.]